MGWKDCIDTYTLPFREHSGGKTFVPMMTNSELGRIELNSIYEVRSEKSAMILEEFIEDMLIHETIHLVLCRDLGVKVSRAYDNISCPPVYKWWTNPDKYSPKIIGQISKRWWYEFIGRLPCNVRNGWYY